MDFSLNSNAEADEVEAIIDEKEPEYKKNVRFPEDHLLVSDYFEAEEYWNENRFCSSEELIAAYKKACDRYVIKPIPILLEQLKGIDANLCTERYDMLNLSTVKLDIKHIECLEEVFKRVQFKTLHFENSNIDDDSSISLFEIIEYYQSCLKLNISFNTKLNFPGFCGLSKMLKKSPCIDSLELRGIIFTDTTIPPLNRALRCGSHLRVLHLEYSNICSKNLLILSSALKLNTFLKELYLANNRLVPSDGIHLGSLLKVNRHLEVLDVRNNSLGDVGLGHICDGLYGQGIAITNSKSSQPAQSAAVSTNNHSDNADNTGCDEQIQYESDCGQGLLTLILWSNNITHNGIHGLADALRAHPSIQSLNLGNNQLTSEGIHILRDGLLSNRSLLRLSVPCCRITCEGGVALAEYIADTRNLIRLDLRENDIKTAGLLAISLSMRLNTSINRIDIDPGPKKDANVKGYAESQQEYLKLILNKVQQNKEAAIQKREQDLVTISQSLSNQTDINLTESFKDSIVDENKGSNFNFQNKDLTSVIPDISTGINSNLSDEENHIDNNLLVSVSPEFDQNSPNNILNESENNCKNQMENCSSLKNLSLTIPAPKQTEEGEEECDSNKDVLDDSMPLSEAFSDKLLSPSDHLLKMDLFNEVYDDKLESVVEDANSEACPANQQCLPNNKNVLSNDDTIYSDDSVNSNSEDTSCVNEPMPASSV